MGILTRNVSEEEIAKIKEKKEAKLKELQMREELAKEEKELEEIEKKLDKLRPAKWTNQFR